MFKYGIVLTLLCLLEHTYGDSLVSGTRPTGWMSFPSTWKFPSLPELPSVNEYFRNKNPEPADEMSLLKLKIENLESSHSQIEHMLKSLQKELKELEVLAKIIPTAVSEYKQALSGLETSAKIADENAQVKLPISPTSVSTTINQSGVRTNLTISSTEPESFSQIASSEKPIMTLHSGESIESAATTPSANSNSNNDINAAHRRGSTTSSTTTTTTTTTTTSSPNTNTNSNSNTNSNITDRRGPSSSSTSTTTTTTSTPNTNTNSDTNSHIKLKRASKTSTSTTTHANTDDIGNIVKFNENFFPSRNDHGSIAPLSENTRGNNNLFYRDFSPSTFHKRLEKFRKNSREPSTY